VTRENSEEFGFETSSSNSLLSLPAKIPFSKRKRKDKHKNMDKDSQRAVNLKTSPCT